MERGYYDRSVTSMEESGSIKSACVSMIHVLEHIRDPVSFLQSLTYKRDRVYLFVDVPDTREYQSISEIHLAHLHHFTPLALNHCLINAGFAILHMEAHQPPHHPKSIRVVAVYESGKPCDVGKTIESELTPELEKVASAFRRVEASKNQFFSFRQRLRRSLKKFRRML